MPAGVAAQADGSPGRGIEQRRSGADHSLVSNGIRRSTVVAAAALVALGAAGPASADPAVTPEVRGVPTDLSADLSTAEEQLLSTLTTGGGVRVAALVDTGNGPEVVTLDADSRADATAAVGLLAAQPSVDAAEVPTPVRATGTYFEQYGNAMVRSTEARAEVGGPLSAVTVAVLDTGVDAHPELAAALLPGQNFTTSPGGATDATDRHGHGTHVAGTVGADADTEVEGVAHGVRILPVKVLGDDGSGYSDWTSAGIIWAADNGADVINMSLGGAGASTMQAAAIDYARSLGVTVIAAAGNANSSTPFYPAAFPGVIAVSAVDQARAKASFSNFGSYVDVAAPGVDIISTYLSGQWAGASGTSMAAPHVAGVAALVRAAAPGLSPDEVEQALTSSGTDLGSPGRDDVFGHGLVDAVGAVRAGKGPGAVDPQPAVQVPGAPTALSAQPLAASVRVRWAPPDEDGGAPVTGYRISTYRPGHPTTVLTAPASAGNIVVPRLVNGAGYRFAVSAVNEAGAGGLSALTATVTPRTVPGAPRIGTVRAARSAAVVRWTAPTADGGAVIDRYVVRVFAGGKLVKAVPAGSAARSLTVRGLTPGKAYAFRVLAKNAAGLGAASGLSSRVTPRR